MDINIKHSTEIFLKIMHLNTIANIILVYCTDKDV